MHEKHLINFFSFFNLYLGFFLALTMIVTRSHHFASINHLPDASWALFFLAGFYFKHSRSLFNLCAVAVLSDYVAITWGGISSFCITPAYLLLLPTYALLWAGGRWYAHNHRDTWSTLILLVATVVITALGAELISSASFYFLGGRFAAPTLTGFLPRLVEYFPYSLGAMAFYVGVAALAHSAISWLQSGSVMVQPKAH
jgi:hypothetical protein